MACFDLYIDETGTVGADRDDEPFGCGWVLCERGPAQDELRQQIDVVFPRGFHFNKIRSGRRRVKKAQKLLNLLPSGRFYVGGQIFLDPAYARDIYFDVLSGKVPADVAMFRMLQECVQTAPVTPGGLVDPGAVVPILRDIGRLSSIYGAALQLPIMALMNEHDAPSAFDVHVHFGVVGGRSTFARQWDSIFRSLPGRCSASFERHVRLKVVPRRSLRIFVRSIHAGSDRIFDVADLMAGITASAYKDTDTGEALLEVSESLRKRLSWSPRSAIAHGIFHVPLSSASIEQEGSSPLFLPVASKPAVFLTPPVPRDESRRRR